MPKLATTLSSINRRCLKTVVRLQEECGWGRRKKAPLPEFPEHTAWQSETLSSIDNAPKATTQWETFQEIVNPTWTPNQQMRNAMATTCCQRPRLSAYSRFGKHLKKKLWTEPQHARKDSEPRNVDGPNLACFSTMSPCASTMLRCCTVQWRFCMHLQTAIFPFSYRPLRYWTSIPPWKHWPYDDDDKTLQKIWCKNWSLTILLHDASSVVTKSPACWDANKWNFAAQVRSFVMSSSIWSSVWLQVVCKSAALSLTKQRQCQHVLRHAFICWHLLTSIAYYSTFEVCGSVWCIHVFMKKHIHTYTHTNKQTYIHAYIPTYLHTYIHTYI